MAGSQGRERRWYKQLLGCQVFLTKMLGIIQASCLNRRNASQRGDNYLRVQQVVVVVVELRVVPYHLQEVEEVVVEVVVPWHWALTSQRSPW